MRRYELEPLKLRNDTLHNTRRGSWKAESSNACEVEIERYVGILKMECFVVIFESHSSIFSLRCKQLAVKTEVDAGLPSNDACCAQ